MPTLGDWAATDFAATQSPEGRAWLATVPSPLRDLAHRWDLTIAAEQAWHGYHAVVLPVTQRGQPLALKLTWPQDQARDEADALAAWRGRGAVALMARDAARGALLLERLQASRSLAGVPLAEAATVAGALVRRLAIDAPGSFPSLRAAASQLASVLPTRQRSLADPVPGRWVTLAARLAADLARDPARSLVHADLHYDNVLTSSRSGERWAAIDPKPAAGAPERSVAELLWTRVDELPDSHAIVGLLDTLVESGRLDRAKAVAWGLVRSIDYWLWGLENGLTGDPVRCQRVASALAPLAAR